MTLRRQLRPIAVMLQRFLILSRHSQNLCVRVLRIRLARQESHVVLHDLQRMVVIAEVAVDVAKIV